MVINIAFYNINFTFMRQLTYINGLKGICALLVLINHMSLCFISESVFFQAWQSRLLLLRFLNADFAVHLFVMISAFLAHQAILAGKKTDEMMLKRYFRLAFPVSFVLIAMGLMQCCNLFFSDVAGEMLNNSFLVGEPRHLSELYKAILMSPFGLYYGWLSPLWMMKYVFFAPFIAILLTRMFSNISLPAQLILGLLVIILLYRFDYYYVSVVVGCFISMCYVRMGGGKMRGAAWCSLLILVALSFVEFAFVNQFRAMTVMVIVLGGVFVQKGLSVRLLSWLGDISMGIYLVHMAIIFSLSSYLYIVLPVGVYKCPIIEVTTILTTIVCAWLYTRYVEKPSSKWVNSFVQWMKKDADRES